MLIQNRFPRVVVTCVLFALVLQGCISPGRMARRMAATMLDVRTSPIERLACRGRLIDLSPHSDPFLAQAFFPIGLYDVPESALQDIASAGFNLVVNGGKDARYLRRAEVAGMRVIPYVSLDRMDVDELRVHGRQAVNAWYLFDEPDLNQLAPEEYHRLARQLRKADPTRPIYLTVCSPRRYSDFVDSCDIFAPNPYPIRHMEPERNRLRVVGMMVDDARAAAGHRPVWAILQAFWAEPIWPRNPTPDELRAMAFIALNHGADGIIYFSYKSGDRAITEHDELFRMIKRLNGQMRSLRGVLLVKPSPGAVDAKVTADEGHLPFPGALSIDCSLRGFRGAHLLIAVNPDPRSKEGQLLLPGSVEGSSARELFKENESEPMIVGQGASLTLSFEPYGTRLFWIE